MFNDCYGKRTRDHGRSIEISKGSNFYKEVFTWDSIVAADADADANDIWSDIDQASSNNRPTMHEISSQVEPVLTTQPLTAIQAPVNDEKMEIDLDGDEDEEMEIVSIRDRNCPNCELICFGT